MQSLKINDSSTSNASPEKTSGALMLLPSFLLKPAALLWLWALPQGILALLNLQGYQLIEGNMDAGEQHNAQLMGACNLAVFLTGAIGWTSCRPSNWKQNSPSVLHPAWAILAIALNAAYLWFAVASMENILPQNVRSWLYPETQFLYNQFAFAMLPLFWGILRLAGARAAAGFGRAISVSTGVAIGTPLLLYLAFNALKSIRSSSFSTVVFASMTVVAGIVMFVAICRAILLVGRRIHTWAPLAERITILLVGLALPVSGLLLNRSIPFPTDFQAWEVYALVAVNCGILLLASLKHADWPRGSLYLLSATLPFSLYFFIVFLPFVPLSVVAVIALGTGFLVLTPILLFVLHLSLFNKARLRIAGARGERWVLAGCALAALLLPGFFTFRGLADKVALNSALTYVYQPSIETGQTTYPSNRLNLRRALNNHRKYKNGIFYPLLSPFYSWLVFDNLVLPDDKMETLEKTFFGEAGLDSNNDPVGSRRSLRGGNSVRNRSRMPRTREISPTATLQHLNVGVSATGQEFTTMTLTFTLQSTGTQPAEYAQSLPLPAGAYVSGFRLHVNGKSVPGRITEKKTALWVYTMIRDSERRDPGLLFYNGAESLELRVFPVMAQQPSVVEIDFLVPIGATELQFAQNLTDPVQVLTQVGASIRPTVAHIEGGVIVAAASALPTLHVVPRETYLHLIVDQSAKTAFKGSFGEAITALQKSFPNAKRARVTLANYELVSAVEALTPLDDLANKNALIFDERLIKSGGFSLDRALGDAIRQHRNLDLDQPAADGLPPPQPIFVVLGDSDETRPLSLEFASQWSEFLPQFSIYQLSSAGAPRLIEGPSGEAETPLLRMAGIVRPVVANRITAFPPSVGLAVIEYFDPSLNQWRPLGEQVTHKTDQWSHAVALQLEQASQSRSPGDSPHSLEDLVKLSRETGILLPSTSYIVVENAAQWQMLEASERQKLGQNSELAFRETPSPSLVALIAGFAGYIALRRWRLRRAVPA
jgi:Vault protein inter-alpha-trypsin domain